MNMNVTYWLNCEDKERCFQIRRKGTVFEKEPAYITAYEVCKGLNEFYASEYHLDIPLRDARTGRHFIECATADSIDKMIKWLREKHSIFYFQAMNLCIPLEDPLSMRVKRFWDGEDELQKQIEEYCNNDVAVTVSEVLASVKKERDELNKKCGLSLKKLHNQYVVHHTPPIKYSFPIDKPVGRVTNAHIGQPGEGIRIDIELFDKQRLEKERDELKEKCDNLVKRLEEIDEYGYGGNVCTVCNGRVCDQFIDILNALGVKEGVLYPARGQSKVDALAKAAKSRAEVIFSERQSMQKLVDKLNERIHNQEQTIKTQNESLTKQRKQLNDLGVALRNVKDVTDCEMDDLMKTHGDDIIPVF